MKDEQLMTSQDKVRVLLVSAAMQERAQNGVQSRSHALTMTEKDEPEVAQVYGIEELYRTIAKR